MFASELLALGQALVPADSGIPLVELAWLVRDLRLEQGFMMVLESAPGVPWVEAAREIVSEDPVRAAQVLDEIGYRPGEAYTRLRAAEWLAREGRMTEAEAELSGALAFYREVRATFFVQQGEALLATWI